MDARSLKGHCSLSKKNKKDTQWEHRDKTPKDKAKSQTPATTNQPQTTASKKCHGGQQGNRPATGVNATEVVKKEKDKAKNLSYVKYYTCKQKGLYTTKCPDKPKNL